MEFKIKGDSMHNEKGPEYNGLFQLMVEDKVIYADCNRKPVTGDEVVVYRDGLTTVETFSDQHSGSIAGVVVHKPK